MKLCEKCQQVIRPGEPFDSHDKDSMSASGTTVYLHLTCSPKPRRTAR